MAGTPTANTNTDPALLIQKYLKDFWDLAVRRKWLILSFLFLGIIVGGIVAWLKVDMYRSETVILIEQQRIPEKYVSSVVAGSTAERVATMTQQVLSRTNLQKVVDEFHLFSEAIKSDGYEVVTEGLRKNIRIQTKGNGGEIEAFTISFAHHDPMIAMKVTARLASHYIDENIKIREQFIEGAMEFLDQELVSAKEALDQKEKSLSEYKLKYLGELPGQLDVNLRTLDRLQLEKTQIQESLNSINSRLDLLQKSTHDYEAMAGALNEFENSPVIGEEVFSPDPLEKRIAELKKELTNMLGEYTAEYPDVISLKTQIKNIENQLKQKSELASFKKSPLKKDKSPGVEKNKPIFDPYLNELIGTREELKSQLVTLRDRLTKISAEMKVYEKRIESTPHHEQELLALERDYDNIQNHYQRLHENRINARISGNLDKRQKGERFRILDPANLPTKPEGVPREFLAAGGVGLGAGLGFGLAFLLDLFSPTFRRSEDAEVSLGLEMLATIPSFYMAYGKSMKMVASELETQKGANGKHLAFSQSVDSLLRNNTPNNGEVKGNGGTSGYRLGMSQGAFLPQLNLVTKWRPQSIVAEQYRVAATRLDLLDTSVSHQVVLVTSAMKGEGKTSTSANIAYTLARDLDEKTLLIDCDFKCPNLHGILNLNPEPGVAEYISGVEPLEACLQQIPDMPLWCMSVGNVGTYPVPLAKLQNLSTILEMMISRYRFIILDGPPVLPLADVNVLSGLAHIVLMVVRSGVTPKDAVQKAVEMIHHAGPTRLVLTDAWTQGVPYYVRQSYPIPYSLGIKG
ncbi:polysaccharide biosynthesis tyrosine autokinase [Candidatus Nitrospira neomarina]|uniref:non-specific protein-tyrosine kinase n=1 Tax=Candidatus Nitrospira neomarina TaxID=3020899 RepID=A0AA96JXL4_9BACT|nr:AAA family ATPase [Candidatus Nitrospira neomarina]WNM64032.1 AAA family ATPase [Candidatus Nitrospira neomarina]